MNQEFNLENVKKGECVVCGKSGCFELIICLKCNKQCSPVVSEWLDKTTSDVKSDCCKYDIKHMSKITCSDECHNKFISLMEKQVGKFKKVTDETTGISYRVPTKDIIENGLRQQDLSKYPIWTDKK